MIRDAKALESRPSADQDGRSRTTSCDRWEPLLSVAEERELADRIKVGDQAARRQLILANLRAVVEIARRFRSNKVPLDDLIQEGNLGLIRASADFDPSVHACSFYTYAEIWIKAFIHRALIRDDSLIRIPEHVYLRRRQHRREQSAPGYAGAPEGENAELESSSFDEIAREIGATLRGLDPEASEESGPFAPSHLAEEGEIVGLADTITDNHMSGRQLDEMEQRVLLEVALRGLNPVEAWVIRERYGLCLLDPDVWNSSGPNTRGGLRVIPEFAVGAEADSHEGGRAYFHRSYVELEHDCGLSRYRILQVEEAALEKLRDVLRPCLAHAI